MRGALALARLGGRLGCGPPGRLAHVPCPACVAPAGGPRRGTAAVAAAAAHSAAAGSGNARADGGPSASPSGRPADGAPAAAPPSPDGLPTEVVGRVMAAQANFVRVRVDGPALSPPAAAAPTPATRHPHPLPRTDLLCIVRGLLKKMKRTVLVGDRVTVGAIDWTDGRGAVTGVLPRTGAVVADPAVANVDQVVCVFALARPPFEPKAASRFLVAAEAATAAAGGGGRVVVVLNKADLVPPEEVAAARAAVAAWGYAPVTTAVGPEAYGAGGRGRAAAAAADDDDDEADAGGPPRTAPASAGLAPLRALLAGRLSVLAGPSGVGKSSLINALHAEVGAHGGGRGRGEPEADTFALAVGGVSRAGRGRHTTRHVSLIPLPPSCGGGAVADTPGFNQPDLAACGVGPAGLAALFPEVRARLGGCAFSDCSHTAEPGCALVGAGAGEGGGAVWPRAAWYAEWRGELEAASATAKSRASSKAAREGAVRYKSGAGGVAVAEARLDPKKNRRVSRRAGKKAVQDLLDEEEL